MKEEESKKPSKTYHAEYQRVRRAFEKALQVCLEQNMSTLRKKNLMRKISNTLGVPTCF